MAYTAPGTAVAGDVLTAAFWNQQVRDNMEAVAGPPFARNILYNGAMQIAQRGTSTASITSSGYYTADRWNVAIGTLGTWTQSVTADAPTGRGFVNSLKMLCTTADASPAAGDFMLFKQILEGYDVQRIAKGTSSASPLTLSFWVKANVTGTYIIEIADSTNNRRIAASYTINASATWEYKTVTISADTTGTLANDANAALEVVWWLGAGSTFSSGTLQTTWGTTVNANRAVGQTNLASATSNYWQVTGVQLETGSVATGFEFLPFGDELRRLQRYFQKSFAPETTPAQNISANAILYSTTPAADGQYRTPVVFMTDMRAIPSTITTFNPFAANSSWRIVGAVTDRAVTANADSSKAFHVLQSVTPGALIGHWTASAEL